MSIDNADKREVYNDLRKCTDAAAGALESLEMALGVYVDCEDEPNTDEEELLRCAREKLELALADIRAIEKIFK